MVEIFTKEAFNRFAAALAQTEILPRAALEAYQDALLKRLVSFAFKRSPFYADRLKPLFQAGDEPELEHWNEIPILRRRDLATEIDRINPQDVTSDVGT